MSFSYDANKTHFHNKGFALSLVLKVKLFGTRKSLSRDKLTNAQILNNSNYSKVSSHVGNFVVFPTAILENNFRSKAPLKVQLCAKSLFLTLFILISGKAR